MVDDKLAPRRLTPVSTDGAAVLSARRLSVRASPSPSKMHCNRSSSSSEQWAVHARMSIGEMSCATVPTVGTLHHTEQQVNNVSAQWRSPHQLAR